MLREFLLGNFKAFAHEQRVPLRPITLLYGPNSGGKSSVLHGIALAHEALRSGNLDVVHTELGGAAIDLGGFRQYVHRRDAELDVLLGFSFDLARLPVSLRRMMSAAPPESLDLTVSVGVSTDDQGAPLPGEVPRVRTLDLTADGERVLRLVRRPDGRLAMGALALHPMVLALVKAILSGNTTSASAADDAETIAAALNDIAGALVAEEGNLLPVGLGDGTPRGGTGARERLLAVSASTRARDVTEALRVLLPQNLSLLLRGLGDAVRESFDRVRYLGPLRSFPPRHVGIGDADDPNWRAGGGEAWERLLRDVGVREEINRWLGDKRWMQTPYRLVVKESIASEEVESLVREVIERVAEEEVEDPDALARELTAKLVQGAKAKLRSLVLVDQRNDTPVSHRDVGIGVSQVLPVLVNAYGARGELVVIEQPELHLHPRLQAELGDVFIKGARADVGNVFLLETHSEHLLLRLMRRMRETADETVEPALALRPEDVQVLYVDPDGPQSIVRELPLNARGELVRAWPGGFFEEGLREVFP